ncbi:MAG: hypothetical protein WAW36_13955 [Methylovulum miyakonense]|uniref:hypothetical protein n=1 Tax=Methylovulum miyakonense TaxID=645578 RepID=UPI003BB6E50D
MGDWGSGRRAKTNFTDDHLMIDARQWQREGFLVAGKSFTASWSRGDEIIGKIDIKTEAGQVRLIYNCKQNGGDWEPLNYPVRLQTTSCNYGGTRYWLTCPADGCGKRVAKLYLAGKYFACRQCYRLAYPCQRETENDRIIRKAEKLKARLHWQPGLSILNGGKPKGMHWKTFRRLQAEYDAMIIIGLNGKLAALKKLVHQLGWLDK